ncbi:MAG: hypothetical protein V1495_08475 [Pseudomonadota bacterium]
MTDPELKGFQDCTQTSDCVFVNNGCCDCANGGKETAINGSQKSSFDRSFDCTGTSCTLMARIPPCGSGTVSCTAGLCTYSPL